MGLPEQILLTQPSHLKAFWKCDETSGNLADSSGNAKVLTPTGSLTYAIVGPGGKNAVGFSGGAYASRTDSPIGAAPTTFTYVAVVQGSEQQAKDAFGMGSSGGNNWITFQTGFAAFSQPVNSAGLTVVAAGGTKVGDAAGDVLANAFDGRWHLVIGRYDGTKFDQFKDSPAVAATKTIALGALAALDRASLGTLLMAGPNSSCTCNLQNVAWWDSALTNTEIASLVSAYSRRQNKLTFGFGFRFN